MRIKKLTSWFLTICLLITQILTPDLAQAGSLAFAPAQNEAQSVAAWEPSTLTGKVTQRVLTENSKGTIIHIQDAHAVFEAQKNIQSLIAQVNKVASAEAVFIEGGAGKLDPQMKHFFSDGLTLNPETREAWMKEGHLTGAEAYLMENERARGFGIEEIKSYWDNVELYRRVDAMRSESAEFLKSWYEAWQEEAGKKFKPSLKKYLQTYAQSQAEVSASALWFDALSEYLKIEWNRDLSSVEAQIEFPMLTRYIYLKKMDGTPDFLKIEKQKQEFFASLKSLDRSPSTDSIFREIDNLIEKSKTGAIDFSGAREVFEQLAAYLPSDFSMERWPDLKKLIERIILAGEMDAEKLLHEAKLLHIQIIKKDAQAKTQRALALLLEKQILLTKLLTLELTREDFQKVLDHPAQPQELAAQLERNNTSEVTGRIFGRAQSGFTKINRAYADAVAFYQGAIKREEVMERAILEKTNPGQISIVVTGGFHTEGMESFARKQNWNYVSVMPRISKIQPEDFAHYRRALLGEGSARSEMGTPSEVAAALITSPQVMRDPHAAERAEAVLSLPGAAKALRKMESHAAPRSDRNSPRMKRSATRPRQSDMPMTEWEGARARSESRALPPEAQTYFESLEENDYRDRRLMPAIQKLLEIKESLLSRGMDLLSPQYENIGKVSRKVSVIEQVSDEIYNNYHLENLPLAHRVAFAMAVYDAEKFPGVSRYLQTLVSRLKPAEQYQHSDRLAGARDYQAFTDLFWQAEQELSTAESILLRQAMNKVILSMPRFERRALEKEALVMEMIKEREQAGKGNIPQVVFITDYHGSTRIGSMIGHALGLKNYQNIRTVAELEKRLAAEKIDVSKKNILFVGGSDYVDRGPEPLSGFRFNEWLRKNGKLAFINGNHEWWKDWNILGLHFRVNDVLREISESTILSDSEAFEKIWPFVTTVNWSEAQIAEEKARILKLVSKFRAEMESVYAPSNIDFEIQKFADEIINAGTNPNHSLEWWAREWYEHSQWADVFLDQLNAELLNQAIQQIQSQLTPAHIVNLAEVIQGSTTLAPPQQASLVERIQKDGMLFGLISSESFSLSDNVKAALAQSEKLKAENALIRTENERLSAAGRHSELKPQHKVPTAFELTSNEAHEILSEIKHVIGELNVGFGKKGLAPVNLSEPNLVTPENYRANPVVMETALWDLKNTALIFTDMMENFYVHGIIPVTADKKEFNVRYRNLIGVDAIERLQYDVRLFFDSIDKIEDTAEFRKKIHTELGEAFAVINEWYSDTLAFLKPASIRGFMDQGGPEGFPYSYHSALSARSFKGKKGVVHVGHVEAGKLRKEGIPYWFGGMEGGLIHGDFEASEGGYAGLGAYISHFKRDEKGELTGIRRIGYSETVANYKKQLKQIAKDRKLAEEDAGKLQKLETREAEIKAALARLEKTGDIITDITSDEKDTNASERKKMEPYLNGQNMLDYYVIRFLTENIQTYAEILQGAKDRGHEKRLQYYEQKITWSRQQLSEYLKRYESKINPEIFSSASRSEIRLPKKPEWLEDKARANYEAIYGKNGFLDSLEHKIETNRNLRRMLDSAEILVVIPIANEKSWARTSNLIDDVRRYARENSAKKLKIVAIAEEDSPTAVRLAPRQDEGFQILYKDKKDQGKGASEFAGIYLASRSLKKGTDYSGAQAVVFLDADLKLSNGQESAKSLLGSLISEIEKHPHSAMVLLHALKRRFSDDDGLAHFWTLAFTEALYGLSFFQSHGGEFAVSREAVKALLESGKSGDEPAMSVHDVYDLEHPLMLRLASLISRKKLPESYLVQHTKVYKDHTETEPERIFKRMEEELIPRLFETALSDQEFIQARPDLSQNLFYDEDGLKRRVRDKEVNTTKFFDMAGSFLQNHFHELEPLAHLDRHPELDPFLKGLESERAQIQSAAMARDYIHFEFHPVFFGQVTRNALFLFAAEPEEEKRKDITRRYMLFVKAAFFDYAATILKENPNALLLDVVLNRKDAPFAQAIEGAFRSEIRAGKPSFLSKVQGHVDGRLLFAGALVFGIGLLQTILGLAAFKVALGFVGAVLVGVTFFSAFRGIYLNSIKKKKIARFEKQHELRKQIWDALDAWPKPAIETWTEEDRGVQVFDLEAVEDPYVRASLYLKRAARDFRFSLGQGASAQIIALNIRNNLKQALSNYQKASYDRDAGVLLNALNRLTLDSEEPSPALIHFVEYFILARLRAQPRKAWANAPLPSGGYVLGKKPANSELKEYPLPSQKRILAFLLPGETSASFKSKPLYRDLRKNKNNIQFIQLTAQDYASREALTAKLRSVTKKKPYDVLITPFAGLMPKEQKQYPAELQRYFEDAKDLYELESGRPMDQIFYETDLIPPLANYFVQGDEQVILLSSQSLKEGHATQEYRTPYSIITMLMAFVAGTLGFNKGLLTATEKPLLADAFYRTGIYGDERPQQPNEPSKLRRVFLVSPHPDDDVIAAKAVLADAMKSAKEGEVVAEVIVMQPGENGVVDLNEAQMKAALRMGLGYEAGDLNAARVDQLKKAWGKSLNEIRTLHESVLAEYKQRYPAAAEKFKAKLETFKGVDFDALFNAAANQAWSYEELAKSGIPKTESNQATQVLLKETAKYFIRRIENQRAIDFFNNAYPGKIRAQFFPEFLGYPSSGPQNLRFIHELEEHAAVTMQHLLMKFERSIKDAPKEAVISVVAPHRVDSHPHHVGSWKVINEAIRLWATQASRQSGRDVEILYYFAPWSGNLPAYHLSPQTEKSSNADLLRALIAGELTASRFGLPSPKELNDMQAQRYLVRPSVLPARSEAREPRYQQTPDQVSKMVYPFQSIAHISYEMAPFFKRGGLADVAGDLPPEMVKLRPGMDVAMVMPYHKDLKLEGSELPRSIGKLEFEEKETREKYEFEILYLKHRGVNVFFLAHPDFFQLGYNNPDADRERIFFAKAATEFMVQRNLKFDVIHAHDQAAALVPAFVRYTRDDFFKNSAVIYTAHHFSPAYQGRMDLSKKGMLTSLGMPDELFKLGGQMELNGHLNPVKSAIEVSDFVTTVSQAFAVDAVFSNLSDGLQGSLHKRFTEETLVGINNGMNLDLWRPDVAPGVEIPFGIDDLTAGKSANKALLQQAFGLSVNPTAMLATMFARFDAVKGFDIVAQAAAPLLYQFQNLQFVFGGGGDPAITEQLLGIQADPLFKGRMVVIPQFVSEAMIQRVLAAADIGFAPSRVEPHGLFQLQAKRLGATPITSNIHGLGETVFDRRHGDFLQTGIKFGLGQPALELGVGLARFATMQEIAPDFVQAMRDDAMNAVRSWQQIAPEYFDLYTQAIQNRRQFIQNRSEVRTLDSVTESAAKSQAWQRSEREASPVAIPAPQTFKGKYFVVLDDKTYLLESYDQMLKKHGAENVVMGASSEDGLRLVAELKAKGIADENIVVVTDYQFRGEDTALNLINSLRAPNEESVFKGPILIVSGSIVSRYEIPGIQDGKLSEEMRRKYGLAYLEKNGGYYFREQLLAALGEVIKNPVDAEALAREPLAVKPAEEMQIPQAQIYLQGAINDWEAALSRAVRQTLSALTDIDDLSDDETKLVISKLRQIAIQSEFGAIDRTLKFERRVHDYKSALHQLLSGEMRDLIDLADKKIGEGLDPLRRELSKTESILKSAFHNAYFLQQLFDVLRRLDKIQKMEPLLQQAVIRFQQQHEGKQSDKWDPASGIAQGFAALQNFEAELARKEVEKALIAWGRLRNDYKAVEENLKPLIGEQLGARSSAFLEAMNSTINDLFQAYARQYGVSGLKAAEPGRAAGRIKILKGTEDQIRAQLENLDANQIVVIDQDYSSLSAAGDQQSGIVFSREGAGHLATRARTLGVPLVYLPNAVEMLPDGMSVVLTSENGKGVLRPAAQKEMADAKILKKSRVQVKPVPVNWDVEPQMHMYYALNMNWKAKASLEELSSIMGPKAARLFIMYRDGEQTSANIPSSLFLNFPFFKLILEANPESAQEIRQLENEVQELMAQMDKTASLETVRQKLTQIQSLVADLKIPVHLQKEIREFRNQYEYRVFEDWEKDHYKNPWIPRLIARLSTNTEDLENDPGVGAGVYGSNEISADLNAVSQEDYLKIIMQTFSSFWSWEAFADRRFYGISEEEAFPAMVIQEMAGRGDGYAVLIHTADPASSDPNIMMIELIPGSGRALTSPEPKLQGEPFRFYFDKTSAEVISEGDARVHLRPVMATKKYTVSLKDGKVEPIDYRQYRDFSDPQRMQALVQSIAAHASKIETYFGRPMDIEGMIERFDNAVKGHPDYDPNIKVNHLITVQARPQGGFEVYKSSRQFDVERKKRVEFIRQWIARYGEANLRDLGFYRGPDHEKAYGLGIDYSPDESRGMAETFGELIPNNSPYFVMPAVIKILMTEKEFEQVREGILRRFFFYAKWQHASLTALLENLYEKDKDLFYQVLPYMIPSFGKHPDPNLPEAEWFDAANESLFARFLVYSHLAYDMTEFVKPLPTDQLASFINLINNSGYLMSGRDETEGQLAEAFAARADKEMWVDYLDDDFRAEHAATLNRSEARDASAEDALEILRKAAGMVKSPEHRVPTGSQETAGSAQMRDARILEVVLVIESRPHILRAVAKLVRDKAPKPLSAEMEADLAKIDTKAVQAERKKAQLDQEPTPMSDAMKEAIAEREAALDKETLPSAVSETIAVEPKVVEVIQKVPAEEKIAVKPEVVVEAVHADVNDLRLRDLPGLRKEFMARTPSDRRSLGAILKSENLDQAFIQSLTSVYRKHYGYMKNVIAEFGFADYDQLRLLTKELGFDYKTVALEDGDLLQGVEKLHGAVDKQAEILKLAQENDWDLPKFQSVLFGGQFYYLGDLIKGLNLTAEFKTEIEKRYLAVQGRPFKDKTASFFGLKQDGFNDLVAKLRIELPQVTVSESSSEPVTVNNPAEDHDAALEFLRANDWNITKLIAHIRELVRASGAEAETREYADILKPLDLKAEFSAEFEKRYRARYGYFAGVVKDFGLGQTDGVIRDILKLYEIDPVKIDLRDGDLLVGVELGKNRAKAKEKLIEKLHAKPKNQGWDWNLPEILKWAQGYAGGRLNYVQMFKALDIRTEFEAELAATRARTKNADETAQRFGFKNNSNLKFLLSQLKSDARSEMRTGEPSAIQVLTAKLFAAGFLSPEAAIYYLNHREDFLEVLPQLVSVELQRQEMEKLQSILGSDITIKDGVILSAGLVQQGFLAAAEKVFRDVPFAFIAKGAQKAEALKWIEEQGVADRIFIVDNLQQAQALLKKHGATRIQGMVLAGEPLLGVQEVISFTNGQLQKFYKQAGILDEVQHWSQIFSAFATAA